MRINRFITAATSGVLLVSVAPAAFAGCGGFNPAPNCNPGVNVYASAPQAVAPVGAYSTAPFGHLKRTVYKNTPNVNIMRVHSQSPTVSLGDHPSQFTNGCTPGSSMYCRAGQGAPANVQLSAPIAPAAPVYISPAPMPAPRVTIGSGYNPAHAAPRQYGSTDFVPGIAHVPTSIVDRSPITHIDGVPQPQVSSVTTARSVNTGVVSGAYPSYAPQMPTQRGGNYLGHVVAGQQTYQAPGGGQYWERTSGPTIVDGLPATQVLCRREAPRPAPMTVRVVRPVFGVPHAVPTAVPVPVRQACAPAPMPRPHAGPMPGSRWTY